MDSRLDKMVERGVKVYDIAPDGFYPITGATNAPRGYKWYNNRKSMFTDEYRRVLVKDSRQQKEVTNGTS